MKNIQVNKIKLKLIEITFQHQEQKVTFSTESFKTLGEMKEKAIKKMINLPPDIHCYYNNLDYSKNENKKIGQIFNNQNKILIKLIPCEFLSSRNFIKKPTKNLSKFHSIDNSFEQKNESVKCRKINILKLKKIKIRDELKLPSVKNINSSLFESSLKRNDDNIIINQNHQNKSNDIFPILNNNNNKNIDTNDNNDKNNCEENYNNNSYESFSKIDEIFCYECDENKITHFCRDCNLFLCEKCILSDKHKFHLTIELNYDNIIQNISSYAILVQKDITDNLELNKNIKDFKKIYDDETLYKQKEEINSKLELIIKKYNKIMNGIDSNIKKENKARIKLSLTTYSNTAKSINKEIDNLVENYKIQDSKIGYKELRNFFGEVNDREETLSYFKKSILKYYLMNEINTKLKSGFDKINKILSEVTDPNNPFHLNEKYLQELIKMKIFKIPKSKEEILKEKQQKQEERDQIIIAGQPVGKSRVRKRRNGVATLNYENK